MMWGQAYIWLCHEVNDQNQSCDNEAGLVIYIKPSIRNHSGHD